MGGVSMDAPVDRSDGFAPVFLFGVTDAVQLAQLGDVLTEIRYDGFPGG